MMRCTLLCFLAVYSLTVSLLLVGWTIKGRLYPKTQTCGTVSNTTATSIVNLTVNHTEHSETLPTVEQQSQTLPTEEEQSQTLPTEEQPSRPINILMIVSDQLRFDAVRHIQELQADYDGRFKISTPNIDRLAAGGVSFTTAHCISPSCVPARAGLKTGTTVQRHGLLCNRLVSQGLYRDIRMIYDKVLEMETIDQILVEKLNYTAETYGKWHLPQELFFGRVDPNRQVIAYNLYDFSGQDPSFASNLSTFGPNYKKDVAYLADQARLEIEVEQGEQLNYFSNFPYVPIQLDVRYGYPSPTPLTVEAGFEAYQVGHDSMCGRDTLGVNYTSSAVIGTSSIRAMERLLANYKANQSPFLLTTNYIAPHPPVVATPLYFDYYFSHRLDLYVSPSIRNKLNYSMRTATRFERSWESGFNNKEKIQELAAAYYAMVEELDYWVGMQLDVLEQHGLENDTMVIFTSDHGEMLGAQGITGKGVLLEEAVRVPLVIRLPGQIQPGLVVTEPVSHLDLVATALDYVRASGLDNSDGHSLRRFIEGTSHNADYDDDVVIVELDGRYPKTATEVAGGDLGATPSFMVRKDAFKLLICKKADASSFDLLFDLEQDPYEMINIIEGGRHVPFWVSGKAEHLKALLLEWMEARDGPNQLYSDPKYGLSQGKGDILEIRNRRTWNESPLWISDRILKFGRLVLVNETYVRNEYLYIGRSSPGSLNTTITIIGTHASYFRLDRESAVISQNEYIRVKVFFVASELVSVGSLDATIQVRFLTASVFPVKIGSKLKH